MAAQGNALGQLGHVVNRALKGRNTETIRISPFQGLGDTFSTYTQGVALGCHTMPLQGISDLAMIRGNWLHKIG